MSILLALSNNLLSVHLNFCDCVAMCLIMIIILKSCEDHIMVKGLMISFCMRLYYILTIVTHFSLVIKSYRMLMRRIGINGSLQSRSF
jgi:cellulose synthase/poly-beta-1,6-N-acetylglucosamine synthase-like glycosyltransferase